LKVAIRFEQLILRINGIAILDARPTRLWLLQERPLWGFYNNTRAILWDTFASVDTGHCFLILDDSRGTMGLSPNSL
jgi:hypothetical protein